MSEPRQVTPDFRPGPTPGGIGLAKKKGGQGFRKVGTSAEWELIHSAKIGRCLVCMWLGSRQELPSSLHHVVPRSQGGDDVEDNAVSLCGDGTSGHHGDVENHGLETCRAFASALQQFDSAAYAYAVEKLGEGRFLERYHVVFT